MRTKWIVIVAIILLLLGGGIVYVTGVLPAWRRASGSKPQTPVSPLRIEEQKDPIRGESGVEAQRDFPFQNNSDKSLAVRLVSSDCACSRVSACVAPDDWKELDSPAFRKRAAETTLPWKTLQPDGASFAVPPRSQGLIRMTWKETNISTASLAMRSKVVVSLGINLQVEDGENTIEQRFEIPMRFTVPVWICAEGDFKANDVDIGRLKPGAERTAQFLCCSTTREKFTLTPAPPRDDPCIVYDAPQPLAREEVQALPRAPDSEKVLSAVRVKITVKERAGDKRLDLGPLHRAVVYQADVAPDFKLSAFVNGSVEGEVGLADAKGKNHVDLGTIVPTDPKPVTFTLQSREPQLELTVDEQQTLDFLTVELLDGKNGKRSGAGKSWRVRIVFRSDSEFRGPIPSPRNPGYTSAVQCSVVFVLSRPGGSTERPRRLFVPVRGTIRAN